MPERGANLWTDPKLQSLEEYSFARFKNLSAADIESPSPGLAADPDYNVLRETILLSTKSMAEMNGMGRALPSDSVEYLLDVLTRDSSKAVVLLGNDLQHPSKEVLGYGLIITGQEDIPDLGDIPEALRSGKDIARGLRLFVRPDSRHYGAHESSTSVILERMACVAGHRKIIGKVLVGPDDLDPVWFEAGKALRLRGFEDSGYAQFHPVTYPDGSTKSLHFKWWIFPPESSAGQMALSAYREHFHSMQVWRQQRHAAVAVHFRVNNGRYGCLSHEDDAHDIAAILPGSFVEDMAVGSVAGKRSAPRFRNLTRCKWPNRDVATSAVYDGFFNSDVFPDLLPAEPKEARKQLGEMLRTQAAQLKPDGYLVIRNTVAPALEGEIEMRLAASDGASNDSNRELSTAALFDRFLSFLRNEDRSHVTEIHSDNPNMRRFKGPASLFMHFALVKDYHKDLENEAVRNLCVLSRADIETAVEQAGLKLVSSTPEFNQWIYDNRWKGRLSFHSADGRELPPPPTNLSLVAQKATGGVRIEAQEKFETSSPAYLSVSFYEGKDGSRLELASRPGQTLDLVPWFEYQGSLYILSKNDYPRPIAIAGSPALDGSLQSGYMSEQIAGTVQFPLISSAIPDEKIIAAARQEVLKERAGVETALIKSQQLSKAQAFLPAPHLVDELSVAQLVEIQPLPDLIQPAKAWSGLDSTGVVHPVDALQTLRACQTGDMPNTRLECMIYELLLTQNRKPDPWICGKPKLVMQEGRAVCLTAAESLFSLESSKWFSESLGNRRSFLSVLEGAFSEVDAEGEILAVTKREYVLPAPETGLSTNTAMALPIVRQRSAAGEEEILVGIEIRQSAAAQKHFGSSVLPAVPAFKLPVEIRQISQARKFISARMQSDLGLVTRQVLSLGGKYFSSPGITPELVYPALVEVEAQSARLSPLCWVPLGDLLKNSSKIRDGNLLTAVLRASHAIGIM